MGSSKSSKNNSCSVLGMKVWYSRPRLESSYRSDGSAMNSPRVATWGFHPPVRYENPARDVQLSISTSKELRVFRREPGFSGLMRGIDLIRKGTNRPPAM